MLSLHSTICEYTAFLGLLSCSLFKGDKDDANPYLDKNTSPPKIPLSLLLAWYKILLGFVWTVFVA